MNEDDVNVLWVPAAIACGLHCKGEHLKNGCLLLDEMLGVNDFHDFLKRNAIYDKKMLEGPFKELLKKLGGPHAKAILKAYRIKNGLEK